MMLKSSAEKLLQRIEKESYLGDIPDFAIERIVGAQALGAFVAFTIHSNLPLPTSSSNIQLPKVDPVIIGWYALPHFDVRIGQRPRADRVVDGSIIAMWDMDGEVDAAGEKWRDAR